MSDDLKNILSNSNKDIDNQQLMDYLSKQLSKAESHDLEKMMAEDEFMNDAVEGLEQIGNNKNIAAYTEQLNFELKKQLAKKKQRKEKRRLKEQPWIYLAIITLLLLCIIAYVVIKKRIEYKKQHPEITTVSVIKTSSLSADNPFPKL
jgi:hypothetical protein